MNEPIVRAEGLGKRYLLGENTPGYGRLTESLGNALRRRRGHAGRRHGEVWALRGATFEVGRGEIVGLVGQNGAGKSTLLKLLARVTMPTEGRAEIRGRVGSLLEVGTGFHPELTGRENVYLSGTILGMRKGEIDRNFDQIIEFAELDRFMDTPVKRYSSGMALRLGFAVAAFLEPEVLLVDEVLAVGDVKFREKCLGRIGDVTRDDGRTVFFVSHDLNAVLSICSRALLIEKGEVVMDGSAEAVVSAYQDRQSALAAAGGRFVRTAPHPRFPVPVFSGLEIGSPASFESGRLAHGESVRFVVETNPQAKVGRFGIDVVVTDSRHRPVTYISSVEMQGKYFEPGETAICEIPYLPLAPGVYLVALLAHLPGIQPFDYWGGEVAFEVVQFDPFGIGSTFVPTSEVGAVVPQHEWSSERRQINR
ncbi:MAG TPA: polysaccharide ABC transporter ATP-binding protein [Gaiellaceae bacterium]|nr:polysaccharide ABC transporter ATP-binding protein [Gaiellaceae bacterium]